ncbi:hypothetical protein OAK85_03480 [Mariniblastus sp.]|nr:hypothetical protein [Mariniblastus sp.]MDA7932583.1 hypothetical protein [Mariniblastus sp.]MDC0284396.1 hypothetical protein [Mariniblastus sp.]MDC3255980.1 hypothetical protein [bacterium]
MKSVLYLLCLGLFLSPLGCNKQADIPLPPTDSDFIESTPNLLTARVMSIDFEVYTTSGGVTNATDINANFVDPDKSKHTIVLTLGDDQTIELNAVNETVVDFTYLKQKYGSLSVGDRVVIDKEGNIKVNGEVRKEAPGFEPKN